MKWVKKDTKLSEVIIRLRTSCMNIDSPEQLYAHGKEFIEACQLLNLLTDRILLKIVKEGDNYDMEMYDMKGERLYLEGAWLGKR